MLLSFVLAALAEEKDEPASIPRAVRLELAGGVLGGFGLVATGLGMLPLMVPENDHPIGTSMIGAGGLLVSGLGPVFAWRGHSLMREPGTQSGFSLVRATSMGLYVGGVVSGLTGTALGFSDKPASPWLQLAGVSMFSASTAILIVDTERLRFSDSENLLSFRISPQLWPAQAGLSENAQVSLRASWGVHLHGTF